MELILTNVHEIPGNLKSMTQKCGDIGNGALNDIVWKQVTVVS